MVALETLGDRAKENEHIKIGEQPLARAVSFRHYPFSLPVHESVTALP
jgi:hypothetical protein